MVFVGNSIPYVIKVIETIDIISRKDLGKNKHVSFGLSQVFLNEVCFNPSTFQFLTFQPISLKELIEKEWKFLMAQNTLKLTLLHHLRFVLVTLFIKN